jgi:hypothetical protein
MSTASIDLIRARSTRVLETVLGRTLRDGAPLLIVNSPPGAGKTYLIESVVATAVQYCRLRVAVVAPRAEQTYDILRRLIANFDPMPIQVLLSTSRSLPEDLAQSGRVLRVANKPSELIGGPGVVVSTAEKMVFASDQFATPFDLLICDEAYQVMYQTLAPLFHLARQTLLVGDPGQLPPLVEVDTARFEAAKHHIHWAAPREIARRFPEAPVIQLPVSRRLPQDTVDVVQPALYPQLPFVSAATVAERQLRLNRSLHGDAVDQALDLAASGATLVGLLLPPAELPADGVDDDVAALMAEVTQRALERGAAWEGKRRLAAHDIGGIDPHVASGAAVRRELRARGIDTAALMVDTPEIWQGQERPLMIVKHPLSGRQRFEAFSLEPGRWCVMVSRHQLACIIVARDGLGKALDDHRHNCADRAMGGANTEWAGWSAHRTMWSWLEQRRRLVRV